MQLVIAEKPSVAQSLSRILGITTRKDGYLEGKKYIVSWCFGHLAGLADASVYDERYAKWKREDLPILPCPFRFEISPEKRDQFSILKELMNREDVTEVVNACDAGREGELIFRSVYYLADCLKPMKRCGFLLWRMKPSGMDFRIFAPALTSMGCTKAPCAVLRRTGWWASTPLGTFLCFTAPS